MKPWIAIALVAALPGASTGPDRPSPPISSTTRAPHEVGRAPGTRPDTLRGASGYLSVDGLRLFYRSVGSGEPVMVLHGGPSPGHGYLLPWMARLGERQRVILFDQRGTGRSGGARDSTSLTRAVLVEDVERVRRGLGLKTPFHLLGHSWGGLLALEYALRHPGALRSLVLVSTTEPGSRFRGRVGSALADRRTRSDSAELAELFASRGFRRGRPAVIERIYQLTYRPWLGRPEVADELSFDVDGDMARKGRRTARLVVSQSAPARHWSELSDLEVPTLVVHGDRDPVPLEMARQLADSLPRARLEVLEGVGHFPFAEAPETFFTLLRRFLDGPIPAARSQPGGDSRTFLEVGHRRLHVNCQGEGGPGVLFLHGARSDLETWRRVLPRVARSGRACAYDRPGHGESAAPPFRRTPSDLVNEMDGVAREAGLEAPFVLVGHSLGGLYARLYAVSRPARVAALVLVDPTHEDMHARVHGAVPEQLWQRWGVERTRNEDGVNEDEIAEILRREPLPDVPAWVVTAGIRRGEREGFDPRALDRIVRELHADILQGLSRGHHVVADSSGHQVQLRRPALVARLVRSAMAAARR